MTSLAEALGVKPPTITKMIARMGAQGLVLRSSAQTDRRSYTVSLTPEGREKASGLKKLWKRLEKEAMTGLDERSRKRFGKMLKQISDNLSAAES